MEASRSRRLLRSDVDQLVARLRQFRDGHPAALPYELGHRLQLLARDVDELSPVVDDAGQCSFLLQRRHAVDRVLRLHLEVRSEVLKNDDL